jgi:hypothetical protein
MSRLRDLLVLLGVASAVASSSFVLGQVQKAAAPPPRGKATVEARTVLKKQGAAKAEPAKEQPEAKKAAAKRAVVMRKAIAVRRAGAGMDAQVEQFVQQFRPLFRAEYYFIRRVCDLTPDQRKRVAREGERAVKDAARKFAELQQKMMQGGWRPGTQYPEPQRVLEEVLSKSVTGILSPEQQARYKDELEKRAANRKQVALDNLVAKLDQDLVLSAEQRDKISESLSSHWNEAWCQSLNMLMNIEHFFPNVPDNLVVPFLTENQQKSWRRIPRNQNVFWGFHFGGIMENDPLDDPELVEARQQAEAAGKDAEAAAKIKEVANRFREVMKGK